MQISSPYEWAQDVRWYLVHTRPNSERKAELNLKAQGFTILLVEQNFHFAATLADRYYVMEHGRIVDEFSAAGLQANMEKVHDYLGV